MNVTADMIWTHAVQLAENGFNRSFKIETEVPMLPVFPTVGEKIAMSAGRGEEVQRRKEHWSPDCTWDGDPKVRLWNLDGKLFLTWDEEKVITLPREARLAES